MATSRARFSRMPRLSQPVEAASASRELMALRVGIGLPDGQPTATGRSTDRPAARGDGSTSFKGGGTARDFPRRLSERPPGMTWVTDISTASTFRNGENLATQELCDLSDYLSELGGRSPSRWT